MYSGNTLFVFPLFIQKRRRWRLLEVTTLSSWSSTVHHPQTFISVHWVHAFPLSLILKTPAQLLTSSRPIKIFFTISTMNLISGFEYFS